MTWKADGVRYILVSCWPGTYLVDRKNRVKRLQIRVPFIPDRSHADKSPCKLDDFMQASAGLTLALRPESDWVWAVKSEL